ncbi:hypothetical protein F4777DRAFT_589290 [Nemania sp. FL0916]|nr:hypothetical protein F4777DRAFT_589290 [Nemania sp. FL0916]
MALPIGAIQVVVVSIIAYALAAIAIGLRFWSRAIQKQALRPNDHMIILAMIITTGLVSVSLSTCFAAGLGVHQEELLATRPDALALHLKLAIPAQLLWAAANACNKISILFLYTDLFPEKFFIRVCHVIIAISAAYFLSVFLEAFLLCTPSAYFWDKTIPGGICHNVKIAYLIAGTVNLVIDAAVVILPMPKVLGLEMPLEKKISIVGMFSLGGLISIISFVRVLWLINWDLNDVTYTITPGAIYATLEPTLGIVNACLPTMKPAVGRLASFRLFNRSSKSADISSSASSDWKTSYKSAKSAIHPFHSLNDDIPLTSIRGGCSPDSTPRYDNQISVTTEWVVHRGLK